jgi:citrate lyase subunit beta/citryl-CoA lyase
MVVMRSVMYTPGNNYRMIQKMPSLNADVLVADLEDTIPPDEKETARFIVRDAIPDIAKSGAQVYVRINDWRTGLTVGDLEAIVQDGLDGVVLAKTEGAEDVKKLDAKLTELEKERGLKPGTVAIQLLIETAKGVILAYEAAVASTRVNSLVFGAVDYTRDMRVRLTPVGEEIFTARCWTAVAARAAGHIAIDPPYPSLQDKEGFLKDSLAGRQLGFEGRMLIHPNQIEPSHEAYAPNQEQGAYAREVKEVFEQALSEGKASIALRGQMIDVAVYRTQMDVLAAAEAVEQWIKDKPERKKQRESS